MINILNMNISMQLMKRISEIDEFKAIWNYSNLLKSDDLKRLQRISTIESIGSSNRIEGNKLSNSDIETVLAHIEKQSFKNRDEEEVIGYAELLDTIYNNYSLIPFTENYIKQLHGILLKHVSKDSHHRGEYKKISNAVAAFDSDGNEIGIIFETASPFDTPRFMEELVGWFNQNIEERLLHPIIVIGVFVVHFLAIHPFQDGNGRLSRALTSLLLLKSGYQYVPYSSIESIIEANKDGYYRALRSTQKNIWEGQVDYNPWLEFFVTTLYKQKLHLEEKIHSLRKNADLSKNALAVLNLFENHDELTSKEIAEKTNQNIETVRKILQKLVQRGDIDKYGTTNTRSYRKR